MLLESEEADAPPTPHLAAARAWLAEQLAVMEAGSTHTGSAGE